MKRVLVVPAAGRGTRLGADVPKLLFPVGGRPMIDRLLDLHAGRADAFVLVLHPDAENAVRAHLAGRGDVRYAFQRTPDGMLPAILAARAAVVDLAPEQVWVTWCDQIAVRPETLDRLARAADERPAADMVVATARVRHPYIQFDRAADGRIVRVRERREGHEMPEEGESDAGLFAMTAATYLGHLVEYAEQTRPSAGTGELNFLPFVSWLAARGRVATVPVTHAEEAIGVNTAQDAERVARFLAGHGA